MLVLANILSLIGNILFTSSTLFKKKNIILILQSINHVVAIIAEIIQTAFAGMVQECISLIRNVIMLFIDDKQIRLKKIITLCCVLAGVIIGVVLNIYLNSNIWYGYLPIFATVVYTIFVFFGYYKEKQSELIIKIGMMINAVLWFTYGIFIKLYPISIFNVLTFISAFVQIIILIRKKDDERFSQQN